MTAKNQTTPRPKTTPNPGRPVEKRTADKNGLFGPLQAHTGHKVMRLLGYWVLVQTYGGWPGVAAQPFYSEGSIQRWRLEFLDVFGCHAEDYVPTVAPVLHAAFYGPGNTWDSPAGTAAQDQAGAALQEVKAARKAKQGKGKSA